MSVPSVGEKHVKLRAVEVDDRGVFVASLFTFEDFDWSRYVFMSDPDFARMTPVDVFDRWGYGDTVTVRKVVDTPAPGHVEYRKDPW